MCYDFSLIENISVCDANKNDFNKLHKSAA